MNVVIQIVAFLFVIALLVFIHEAGHFFVARWRRVWVHQFAVGFGPAIWKRQSGETEYSIRLFPLGGFVRMAGEDRLSEEDKAVPADRLFTSKKPVERMVIVAAGPLANIIGAILLQIIIVGSFGVGYTEIMKVTEKSPAQGQLESGDKIVEINSQMIYSREQMQRIIRSSEGRNLHIKVLRGEIATPAETKEFDIATKWDKEAGAYRLGIVFAFYGSTNKIQSLEPDSFLAKNGLKAGDHIVAVDATKVYSASQFMNIVETAIKEKNYAMHLQASRNGEALTIELNLANQEFSQILAGYRPEFLSRQVGFFDMVRIGFAQIGDAIALMYETIRSVFSGKSSASEQFSGPVGIAGIIGQSISLGLMPFLIIVTLLSLNLGLINLFPFPALDGSRIVFILVEMVIRRPIPPDKEGMVHYIGFIILLALILLITFNDIKKMLGQ